MLSRQRMRLGFFVQGEQHLPLAQSLIASAKKAMPDVEVFQLTDGKCPAVTEAIRIPGEMPMGVRRVKHYANLQGDWLFLDTDILIRKDVRDVFDKPFDVAVASRTGTIWENCDYAAVMPYNFGVVFSRNPKFWQAHLAMLQTLPKKLQEWEGEQLVLCALAKRPRSPYKVEVLPSSYNWTPAKKQDDISHAHILHLKGPRKAWLPDLAL